MSRAHDDISASSKLDQLRASFEKNDSLNSGNKSNIGTRRKRIREKMTKKEQEETMKSNTIVLPQEGFYFLMENIKGLLAYKVARYIFCLISD